MANDLSFRWCLNKENNVIAVFHYEKENSHSTSMFSFTRFFGKSLMITLGCTMGISDSGNTDQIDSVP